MELLVNIFNFELRVKGRLYVKIFKGFGFNKEFWGMLEVSFIFLELVLLIDINCC